MAGTATEQFVGLGKPAIAIPGMGPQFTAAFGSQSRHLGPSLILVEQPTQVARVVQSLLTIQIDCRLPKMASGGWASQKPPVACRLSDGAIRAKRLVSA